jgi:hypothetical protein
MGGTQRRLNADDQQRLYDAVSGGRCFCPADIAARAGWSVWKAQRALGLLRRMAGEGASGWTIPHQPQGPAPVAYRVWQVAPREGLAELDQRTPLHGVVQSIEGARRRSLNDAAAFDILGRALGGRSVLAEACLEQAIVLRGSAAMAKRVVTETRRYLGQPAPAAPRVQRPAPAAAVLGR